MPPLRGFIFMMRVVPMTYVMGCYHIAPPGLRLCLTITDSLFILQLRVLP
jgi:hypothetical protein